MCKWQPIKTAPLDGTMVLCFWQNQHGGRDDWGVGQFSDGIGWHEANDKENDWGDPTHWMPLPDPPPTTGEKHD